MKYNEFIYLIYTHMKWHLIEPAVMRGMCVSDHTKPCNAKHDCGAMWN